MPKTQKELDEENMFADEENGEIQDQELDEQGNPKKKEQEDSDDSDTGTGTEEFSHPLLRGKSTKEIEDYLRVLEITNREQSQRLQSQNDNPRIPREEEVEKPKKATAADFFEDPIGNIETLIKKQLESSIAPFREDMALSKAQQAWVDLNEEFSDSNDYKALMKELMKSYGVQGAPNIATLRTFYKLAMAENVLEERKGGKRIAPKDDDNENERKPSRNPPPQHRASNQPIRSENGNKKLRPLTESERIVAKMQGFNVDTEAGRAAYLKELEEDSIEMAEATKEKK